MSPKSIALFETHKRANASTVPAPPSNDPVAELERQERKYAHRASRNLSKARECRAMIDFLQGKPRNDLERRASEIAAEFEAIESGCVDSDDPRHPNHSLNCVRPCCSRREIEL